MPLAEPVSVSRLLVADVGGTNARFAIADLETIALFDIEEFKCARHSSLAEANQFQSTSSSPNSRPSRVQRWDSANTSRQPSRHSANPCVPILHLLRLRQKNKSCFLPQTCAAEHLGSLAWAQIASSRVSPWGDKQSLQHSFCNVAKIKRRWLSLRAVCQLI